MESLDLYLKIYKSDLRKDLKLYLYNYIYLGLLKEFSFSFNRFNYLTFYIVNNKEIYFEEPDTILKSRFENCFIKLDNVKVYRIDLEGHIIKEYLTEKFEKFLNFLERNKHKINFLKVEKEKDIKVCNLEFNFSEDKDINTYLIELKKYLEFLNLYYLFVFKDFNIKKYFLELNKYKNAEFNLWCNIFSENEENFTISSDGKIVISLMSAKLSKGKKKITYWVYPINILFNVLKRKLEKLYKERGKRIIEQYGKELKKIIYLGSKVSDIRKILFLEIILDIWCDTDYWNRKLGYKKRIIKTEKFKNKILKVFLIERGDEFVYISLNTVFPFFKEKQTNKKIHPSILQKMAIIEKKFQAGNLFSKENENILDTKITLGIKDLDFLEVKSNKDTLYFMDKESEEIVYKVKVNLKIEKIIS